MRTFIILCTFLLQFTPSVYSQNAEKATIEPNLKYGKPSEEELTLTTYSPDTTASAIYLFHQGESKFTYRDGFQLATEHWVRIKILKPQGVSYANVTIPYYSPADHEEGQERAFDIEGCSYNMENGKSVKTPMKKESISFERVDNRYKVLKFSLPVVKEGTVIEYHYKLLSDYFSQIDNWMMQKEIPILYNQYKTTIPHVFIYNIELRGKDHIQIKQKQTSIQATARDRTMGSSTENFSISAQETTFTSRHLPAIRQDEAYCWCPEDYKVQISFDLQSTQYPGSEPKSYSQKWEDVDRQLLKPDVERFGALLAFPNPFREETKWAYKNEMGFEERVMAAFRVLKNKLTWNKRYQIYSKELNKVIKRGNGSNADLNFIFISILKDFGLNAYPVVMSRRSTGMLPVSFPSLQKLNTFVVAIYDAHNQKYVFLDSSMDVPAINVLPLDLCVDKARILAPHEEEATKWVNLMNIADNKGFMKIEARVEGNRIKGHRTTVLQGQEAIKYQQKELPKQDSIATNRANIDNSSPNNPTISNLTVKKQENNPGLIEEELDFSMPFEQTDSHLYVNPMLFPLIKTNPFIQTERVLPVEFPYPYTFATQCTLTLPEGYAVEELPSTQVIRTEGDDMLCRYIIQQQGNTVILNYIFHLKKYMFHQEKYEQLQAIWAKLIERNNAMIVLKKL